MSQYRRRQLLVDPKVQGEIMMKVTFYETVAKKSGLLSVSALMQGLGGFGTTKCLGIA